MKRVIVILILLMASMAWGETPVCPECNDPLQLAVGGAGENGFLYPVILMCVDCSLFFVAYSATKMVKCEPPFMKERANPVCHWEVSSIPLGENIPIDAEIIFIGDKNELLCDGNCNYPAGITVWFKRKVCE